MPVQQFRNCCLKTSKSSFLLTFLTLIAVLVGFGVSLILRTIKVRWTQREITYITFIGNLFLNILKALVLPLIFASLVSAIGSIDISLSKRIGIRVICYYITTTVVAVALGLSLVVTIKPGHGVLDDSNRSNDDANGTSILVPSSRSACQINDDGGEIADNLLDIVRNIFPPNLIEATMKSTHTVVINSTDIPEEDWKYTTKMVEGTNMMGLVTFAAVLGITLGTMGAEGKPLLDVFVSLANAMVLIASKVVWFSPIAICSLLTGQLLEQTDMAAIFKSAGWFIVTVWTGLFIHGFIILPLIFFICTRTLPFKFIGNMTQALATAFGTSSSSATLPLTLTCLEGKNNIDRRVSRFMLPIGATINMDGLALFLPIAVIYMAQLCGAELSFGRLVLISLISVTTSIGAAGVGGMGLVMLITVLDSVGLPGNYIPYVMSVSWLIGGIPTVVNVLGDAIGAGIVNHLCKSELQPLCFNTEENEPSMNASQCQSDPDSTILSIELKA